MHLKYSKKEDKTVKVEYVKWKPKTMKCTTKTTNPVSSFPVTQTSRFPKTPSSSTLNPTALRRWPGLSTLPKSSCTSTSA